jgi:hypothetical protein
MNIPPTAAVTNPVIASARDSLERQDRSRGHGNRPLIWSDIHPPLPLLALLPLPLAKIEALFQFPIRTKPSAQGGHDSSPEKPRSPARKRRIAPAHGARANPEPHRRSFMQDFW